MNDLAEPIAATIEHETTVVVIAATIAIEIVASFAVPQEPRAPSSISSARFVVAIPG